MLQDLKTACRELLKNRWFTCVGFPAPSFVVAAWRNEARSLDGIEGQRDYGGANDVLGRALTLDEAPHVVVGVMPPRWDAFARGLRPDIWLPLSLDPASAPVGAFQASEAIARLRPGVDRDAVRRELDPILARVEGEAPRRFFGNEASTARIERPADRINASTRDALLVLLGAVGLVLLVACSNVPKVETMTVARRTASKRPIYRRAHHEQVSNDT